MIKYNRSVFEKIDDRYIYTTEKLHYDIVGIFLQGSQNYGCDWEKSDIDVKAITVPSLREISLNKPIISITHVLPSQEHIDLKDIRLMFNCFKKQNTNFLEILFTPYMRLNSEYDKIFYPLIENNEKIAHYNNYAFINSVLGTAHNEYKNLLTNRPGAVESVEKYGYDVKCLAHIVRFAELLERYVKNEPFAECLQSKKADEIIAIKQGFYRKKDAIQIAENADKSMVFIKSQYMENHPLFIDTEVEDLLDCVLVDIFQKRFKKG